MFISQLKLAVENKALMKSCFCVNIAAIIKIILKDFPFIVKLQIKHVIQISLGNVIGIGLHRKNKRKFTCLIFNLYCCVSGKIKGVLLP